MALTEGVVQMGLNRSERHIKALRDVLVGKPLKNILDNLTLARRKSERIRHGFAKSEIWRRCEIAKQPPPHHQAPRKAVGEGAARSRRRMTPMGRGRTTMCRSDQARNEGAKMPETAWHVRWISERESKLRALMKDWGCRCELWIPKGLVEVLRDEVVQEVEIDLLRTYALLGRPADWDRSLGCNRRSRTHPSAGQLC